VGLTYVQKNVGIWLWGWVLFLFLFPLILFHQSRLRGLGVSGTPGGIASGHRKISASTAEHEKALVLKKNGLGAIGDLFWTGWVFHFNCLLSVLGVIGLVWNWFFINWGLFLPITWYCSCSGLFWAIVFFFFPLVLFLQVPYSCAIDEPHVCCLLSRFIPPMRFYISRVLECFLCCQTLFFFLVVQFFASLPIAPNISLHPLFLQFIPLFSTCTWMDQRGAYLVFDLFVVTGSGRANKKAKKSRKTKKNGKGHQRRWKEGRERVRERTGGGREGGRI